MFQYMLLIGVAALVAVPTSSFKCNYPYASSTSQMEDRLMQDKSSCAVPALTAAGWVCGTKRSSYKGAPYASFRGVPYAKQPVGELRFKTLEPLKIWDGYYNASVEGPVCPQKDEIYERMMQPQSIAEDCIRANVHVPWDALPTHNSNLQATVCQGSCLPILVFATGGGFTSGSGDSDVHGPEYMIDHNVIVVTFNYRVGPFGYLSLNSTDVPGNAALRDIVTLLRWVQINARAFGGNPDNVTLMGQSASAAAVHFISLSRESKGLFKRVIAFSGNAVGGFYSTTPEYAQNIKERFLARLGINSSDSDEIHQQLLAKTTQELIDANAYLQDTVGLVAFAPVKETAFAGVTRMIEDDPATLLAKGFGRNYPILIGYTNVECIALKGRLQELNIVETISNNPIAILPAKMAYQLSNTSALIAQEKMKKRYFNAEPTIDEFINVCSDSFFIYPAFKLAEIRAAYLDSAPAYLLQISYDSPESVFKEAYGLNYTGTAHAEDLTYIFRVNSILGNRRLSPSNERMKDWMTTIISNFMRCSTPTCESGASSSWPPVTTPLQYQDMNAPRYDISELTDIQRDMVQMYDELHAL